MDEFLADLKATAGSRQTKFTTYKGEEFDRSAFLTASEHWYCARQIWFSKRKDVPLGNWGFYERGHHMEDWVIKLIRDAGYLVRYAGNEQVTLTLDNLSGTPDGVIVDLSDEKSDILLEVKSIDPRTNIDNLPKHEHKAQAQMNMVLFNRIEDIDLKPKRAWIIYVDASDYSQIQVHEVKYDPGMYVTLQDRANKILKANDAMSVDAEGKLDGSCRFCAFADDCGEAIIADMPRGPRELDGDEGAKLLEIVNERMVYYNAEKEANKARKLCEEEIKKELTELEAAQLIVGPYKVTYTEVAGRHNLDKKKLEEVLVDLEPYYTIGKPTTRLTIKEV